jgi:hypothetical protein
MNVLVVAMKIDYAYRGNQSYMLFPKTVICIVMYSIFPSIYSRGN